MVKMIVSRAIAHKILLTMEKQMMLVVTSREMVQNFAISRVASHTFFIDLKDDLSLKSDFDNCLQTIVACFYDLNEDCSINLNRRSAFYVKSVYDFLSCLSKTDSKLSGAYSYVYDYDHCYCSLDFVFDYSDNC